MSSIRVARSDLESCDLILDAIYEGGRAGNSGDDPLGPLLGVSNQGGFRHLGRKERPNLLVITTSMSEPDWPDWLDLETGTFTYYGDNRRPGRGLHETPRWGNQMLSDLFSGMHAVPSERSLIPPILIFRRDGVYRDVRFLGLAVPGAAGLRPTDDLVAIWRHSAGRRFQNYRAIFTVLDVGRLSRQWIVDIRAGMACTSNAPPIWLTWQRTGQQDALRSVSTAKHRTRDEQLPDDADGKRILAAIHGAFRERPHEFEACAAALAEMLLPNIVSIDLTRMSRDGGRDAMGMYRIGLDSTAIEVEFSLEAKCNDLRSSVGVRETSRLISRLRHRQFGILVTTSYVDSYAYKELKEDKHPVVIVSGKDIVTILVRSGLRDAEAVTNWLDSRFSGRAERKA